MFFLLERWERISPKERPSNTASLIKDTISEILCFKKRELVAFNVEIATSIALIFDKLAPYYEREERALRLRLSKNPILSQDGRRPTYPRRVEK
jgi:hypothetical protein